MAIDLGMLRRLPKPLLAVAAGVVLLGVVYFAYSRPWYFTSQTYLGGLILLELVAVLIWKYRQVFFASLMAAFLFAGTGLPGAGAATSARWLFLAVGAAIGFLILVKERQLRFGIFHAVALFAVLASAASAVVSRYPSIALLKVSSLFLLFLYAASGARVAVRGREARFFSGLLLGCEILVSALAVAYLALGASLLGNPNSLGAIMGVVCAPVLLWGTFAGENVSARRRRLIIFAIALYLVYHSHSRASIASVAFSCSLLCLGLRKYRALITGIGIISILVATAAILLPETFFEAASTVTSEVVYKPGPGGGGVLASRESPWQSAVDTIRSHFWFGTGFGTTGNGQDASQHLGSFASSSEVTTEYGSSYLEIATWVGVLGVLPFFLLLLGLVTNSFRTVLWMLRKGDASAPAIPLAVVVIAGIVHAAFEDWMFAPGYYLCVFFWCMGFLLVDYSPLWAPMAARGRLWWVPVSKSSAVDAGAPIR